MGIWRKGVVFFVFGLLLFGSERELARAQSPTALEGLRQYQGKIVALNFWASWCKPCRKEMPMLMEFQREFESRGVQFIGASTDKDEDRGQAEDFVARAGIGYPIWYGLSEQEMKPLYLGEAIPATAIFDRDGTEIFRIIGEVKKKALRERLEWLLGDRESKPPKELLLPLGVSSKPYRKP